MTKSELVGYVRKNNVGNSLKISILKSAFDKSTVVAKDGEEYVTLVVNMSKIRMLINDEKEIASINKITGDE